MSRKYKVRDSQLPNFVTFTVQHWVNVFTRVAYINIVLDSLRYCQQHKGLKVWAWCIMSNHLHLIVSAEESSSLPEIIRDLKKYTSKKIIEAIQTHPREKRRDWMLDLFHTKSGYRFWIAEYMPKALFNNAIAIQKLNYIHLNPVKAGMVFRPEDYVFSSARDYAGEKGMLDIELLDLGFIGGSRLGYRL
jgi:REP element-mobilizing transposase RayT